MKIKSDVLYKSFWISLVVFSLIAGILICDLYIEKTEIDLNKRDSNLVIGITSNDKLLCVGVLHTAPKNSSVTLLPIHDNLLLSDGSILQDYNVSIQHNSLLKCINELTGAYINRYLFISVDDLARLTDEIGGFEYLISYPFEHNGVMKSGNVQLDGSLTRSMFTYSEYDMSKVSLSDIGLSYICSFLSSYSNLADIESTVASSAFSSIKGYIHTDLSDEELIEYFNYLSDFNRMTLYTLELSGYIRSSSSRTYFIPETYKTNKNIFK